MPPTSSTSSSSRANPSPAPFYSSTASSLGVRWSCSCFGRDGITSCGSWRTSSSAYRSFTSFCRFTRSGTWTTCPGDRRGRWRRTRRRRRRRRKRRGGRRRRRREGGAAAEANGRKGGRNRRRRRTTPRVPRRAALFRTSRPGLGTYRRTWMRTRSTSVPCRWSNARAPLGHIQVDLPVGRTAPMVCLASLAYVMGGGIKMKAP
mmetsp:Transcript_30935/g.63202  ORF Transcript_30935/g.63202 Transcript_30935/m.63202 type:complete len:204 (+) Transcript_30935:816-1427(+)